MTLALVQLCLRYCDKGSEKEFNYMDFVDSVDVQDHARAEDRTITDTLGSLYFRKQGRTTGQPKSMAFL